MDPQTKLGQRGTQSAIDVTGEDPVHSDPIVPTLTDVTELAVGGTIQGTHAQNPVMNTIAQNAPVQNPVISLCYADECSVLWSLGLESKNETFVRVT